MPKRQVIIIGVGIVVTLLTLSLRGDESEERVFFGKRESEVVECRVSMYLGHWEAVDWRTRKVKLMRELFLDPLTRAKEDPEPKRYEILGLITVTRKDGSKELFKMFLPWGRIERDNKYLIADLRQLKTAFEKALKEGVQSLK